MIKILILDVETSPHLVYVWKFFKENVAPKQVLENGYMLSWAAKWFGSDKVFYEDKQHQDERSMLEPLAALLDEADIVVAHNAVKFDVPTINARFLVNNINPPSPYKIVDTLQTVKKEFKFPSNSLEYLGQALDLPIKKGEHKKFAGFNLWLGVLKDDPDAWGEMKRYNIDDIYVLEALYIKLRPFMRNHPNVGVYMNGEKPVCPKCGSHHIQYRGYAHTTVGRFHRIQCQDCFGWSRTRQNLRGREEMKNIIVNAVN